MRWVDLAKLPIRENGRMQHTSGTVVGEPARDVRQRGLGVAGFFDVTYRHGVVGAVQIVLQCSETEGHRLLHYNVHTIHREVQQYS